MKKWVIIIVALLGLLFADYIYNLITLKPHWVYLHSLGNDGKVVTVFYPKWFSWNNKLYIIPRKYTDASLPESNYVKTYPRSEASLSINWQPKDGLEMKIQYPWKDMVYENHLDTTQFMIYRNGDRNPGYIDKGDSFYSPKYRGFDYSEWIINGRNDSSAK